MKMMVWLFSFLCAQDAARSFVIAGRTLPLCQRCTGVYVGLAASAAFLWLSGLHRRGLPPRSIFYANVAGLALMPVFGFHVLDPGPLWRFWSGLIFGNAVAFLAVPAVSVLLQRGRVRGRHTRGSVAGFWGFYVLLNAAPLGFSVQALSWYWTLLAMCVAGVGGMALVVGSVAVFLCAQGVVLWRSWEVRPWVRSAWKRWGIARSPSR
ncbi:MAG: DUF2085 domain-containing protein [Planctomycetes bacterium]|jgi:hypothetical protein|nr:DUF2085 domain-containing protein [Planctomycetota bacterium]